MHELPSSLLVTLTAACRFKPAAVMAFGAASIAAAFNSGQVTMLAPVAAGGADEVFADHGLVDAIDAGLVVLLAFEAVADAERFDRLLTPTLRH